MRFVKENKTFRQCDLNHMSTSIDKTPPPTSLPSSVINLSDSSGNYDMHATSIVGDKGVEVCALDRLVNMPDLEVIGRCPDACLDVNSVDKMDLVCRSRLEASSSEALQSTLRGLLFIFSVLTSI